MMRRCIRGWIAALALVSMACDPEVITERRQVELTSNLGSGWFESGDDIVEHSRVCLTFESYRESSGEPIGSFEQPEFADADADEIRACYDEQLAGPSVLDEEGCLILDTPGTVTWSIVRRDCELRGDFGDDRVRFEVVGFDEVEGAFSYAVPPLTEFFGIPITWVPEAPPEGVVARVGEPIYVIEDEIDSVVVTVVRGDPPHEVAFSGQTVSAEAIAGTPVLDEPAEGSGLGFDARAGDAFHVSLQLPAGTLEVGDVHVVSRHDIASMQWVPSVSRIGDTDLLLAVGAKAVARDENGRVLRGPPATWSVSDGDYQLETFDFDEDGAPDPRPSVSLADPCEGARAGEQRSTIIGGRLDAFEGSVEVEWTCFDDHRADGCGCREDPKPRPSALLLGWMLLLCRCRRRAGFTKNVGGPGSAICPGPREAP